VAQHILQEYILKGVVHAALGQSTNDSEQLALAQQYFQLVGASASECDTIPGRQCMASCFFLLKQFDDVLIFLNSIQTYFADDDDYNWNLGVALANTGAWKEVGCS
jgi:intraflagellar transport protein 56